VNKSVNALVNARPLPIGRHGQALEKEWRRVPELNRSPRICNSLMIIKPLLYFDFFTVFFSVHENVYVHFADFYCGQHSKVITVSPHSKQPTDFYSHLTGDTDLPIFNQKAR